MDETLADLADDLDEIGALAEDALVKLRRHRAYLEKSPSVYFEETRTFMLERVRTLEADYETLRTTIQKEIESTPRGVSADAQRLIAFKKKSADMLRTLQTSLGSALAEGDWQSPSFAHTDVSQAGVDEGHIIPGDNDYRRDAHSVERSFGRAFSAEYINHPLRIPPHVSVTNSGMAAITAALTLAAGKVRDGDGVLAGKSSYFQSRWVLEKLFPGKVTYIDEFDTEGIVRFVEEKKPRVVLFDTLCNAPEIPVLDATTLVPLLAKHMSRDSTLILDNTGLATSFQPLKYLPLNPLGMRLIVVESLLKYHEFGMDRVTAGVVWSPFDLAREEPFVARMHGGTIAPDVSVHMLPGPDRARFDRRLARLARNAGILAEAIDTAARNGSNKVSHAVYPGLPSYRGYAYTKDMSFHGGFLTLAFRKSYASISHYDRFVAHALKEAKTRGLDLVGGTSFGFNTTRISVPARYSGGTAEPFVRIAAGTETKQEIEALASMFADVVCG